MTLATIVGCSEPRVTGLSATSNGPGRATAGVSGVQASASGGGHYLLQGLYDTKFSFSANENGNGDANGELRVSVDFGGADGTASFTGVVTCMASDPVNRRAWIGGVITQNNSTSPDYQVDITQPGRDIWFRVLDSGEGTAAAADRTSFVGFTGSAGIQTSAEYCAARIWAAENARTHAVTNGNIQVR
jgi:hypothetical protein